MYTPYIARAEQLNQYDDAGGLINQAEVIAALQAEFSLSLYRAQSAVAQAARRHRYHLQPDDIRRLTPSTAADEFGGSSSNIRRACVLGYIDAHVDAAGRWSFTVAGFKAWLENGKHKPGVEPK